MAYLDENGLEHFWGKIKDRVSSAVAPKANDADVVHKTGDEVVQGVKTFQNTASNTGSATVTALELRNPNISRGDTGGTDGAFTQLLFLDKDGEAQGTHIGRLGLIESGCKEGKANILVCCYKPSSLLADANERVNFLLGYDDNGVPFASATSTPLPSVRNGDTDIITRNFIPLDTRIVHTTGNESIAGEKTFTSDAKISKSYPTFSLVSTSGNWSDLYFQVPDATAQSGFKTLTVLRSETSETGTFQISRRFNGGSNAWSGPSVQLEGSSGDFLFEAQNATQSIVLRGAPDGTLTWGGQPIQTTSDERLKTTLSEVPDAVLDAWEDVNWGQFQYLDAIASKGESARLHLGLIAQHVMSVFGKHGLDACDYGILCHEERPAVDEEETVVDAEAYTDEEGVEHPAVTHVETRHEDAVDLWMVRYAEAQAMEACCMRRENARLKKRIAGLEERLAALELKIS